MTAKLVAFVCLVFVSVVFVFTQLDMKFLWVAPWLLAASEITPAFGASGLSYNGLALTPQMGWVGQMLLPDRAPGHG